MEISAQEYLMKLKEIKSYIRRCRKIISNPIFWPSNKHASLLKYYSELGRNVVAPLSLLQTNNFSLANPTGAGRVKLKPYRAFTPVDRAILGNHIVIAIDKRDGSVKVCHTYEDGDAKNPIKPLNEAIDELEKKIKSGEVSPDDMIDFSGVHGSGPLRYALYRIITYNNDNMTYPVTLMYKYAVDESIYDAPRYDAFGVLDILQDLSKYVCTLKADSELEKKRRNKEEE